MRLVAQGQADQLALVAGPGGDVYAQPLPAQRPVRPGKRRGLALAGAGLLAACSSGTATQAASASLRYETTRAKAGWSSLCAW